MSLAPLATLDDVKLACKIDLTDSSLDGLMAATMAAAESMIQVATGVPITVNLYIQTDRTIDMQPTATFAPPQSLLLRRRPIETGSPFSVMAYDGSVVDPTTYNIDPVSGIVYANLGSYFGLGPYTITYYAGLAAHPEWAIKYRAIVAQLVRDISAWIYNQPDSSVKAEAAGGGVSQDFDTSCLPLRIRLLLRALPNAGAAIGM